MWLNSVTKRVIAVPILLFLFFPALVTAAQDDAANLRNPFIPIVSPDGRLLKINAVSTGGDLVLEGIIYDEKGESYCIINGTVVKPQESIDGWEIAKIQENKVIVSKGDQYRELEIRARE